MTDKWLQTGQPLGDRAPGGRASTSTSAATPSPGRIRTAATACAGSRAARSRALPATRRCSGYRVNTCNTLRLWKSEAVESFDFQDFNVGDYYGAVAGENDLRNTLQGALPERRAGDRQAPAPRAAVFLRLLLAAGHAATAGDQARAGHAPARALRRAAERHPSVDRGGRTDAAAGGRAAVCPGTRPGTSPGGPSPTPTTRCCPRRSRPGACRSFQSLLPRPLEIIYEINRRFLDEVRQRFPGDDARVARMSLIDEAGDKRVRMAHLATVGSHAVNGVAALHSTLLRQTVLRDFAELWPERFRNVTNGVTPAALRGAEQPGAGAAARRDGRRRTGSPTCRGSRDLEALAGDAAFQERWRRVKRDEQGGAGAPHSRAHRRGRRSRTRCSTSRSSASTSTSAST